MTVSVIIPVYNVAPYLCRCVESVLRQTYRDMEIILVDDGSTDGSGAICDEYASASFASFHHSVIPIRVIHKPNGGLSDARNAGLKVATGEYVMFLDSDDEWLIENGIEQLVNRLEQRPSDIIYYKHHTIYADGKKVYSKDHDAEYYRNHSAEDIFSYLVYHDHFGVSACMLLFRRQVLAENHIQFKVGLFSEDIDFSYRLWQKIQSVDALNIDLYGYNRRENSISTSYTIRNLLSYDWMFTYWGEQVANKCINHQAIGVHMANLYVGCCYQLFNIARKDRKKAKQVLLAHQDLLQHAVLKKSLRMKKVVDKLGINAGIFIFATYGWLKKYYMALTENLAK